MTPGGAEYHRKKYPRGTNHAQQLHAECHTCGTVFDTGVERSIHPAFIPTCYSCWISDHRPDKAIRTGITTTHCRCGWFTTGTADTRRRRFAAHRNRTEGIAAA